MPGITLRTQLCIPTVLALSFCRQCLLYSQSINAGSDTCTIISVCQLHWFAGVIVLWHLAFHSALTANMPGAEGFVPSFCLPFGFLLGKHSLLDCDADANACLYERACQVYTQQTCFEQKLCAVFAYRLFLS